MSSLALDVFHRLVHQVDDIERTAVRAESEGFEGTAPILRRSGFVLAVAAFDSYFHERGIELLHSHGRQGGAAAAKVANYVQSVSATDVAGPSGEARIRLRLSFRTLVAPAAIDRLLAAAGRDADDLWLAVALSQSTRPERLRRLLEILYDRRNQIAHEADWDPVQLDFRPMERAHLEDCRRHVVAVVEGFDAVL